MLVGRKPARQKDLALIASACAGRSLTRWSVPMRLAALPEVRLQAGRDG